MSRAAKSPCAHILSRAELTEQLRGWTRAILGVSLEEFLDGYPLGKFNHKGSAHDLASLAAFLKLTGEHAP